MRDPHFGPLAMVGGGGVEVEAMHDVAFGLAPVDAAEAGRMLDATRAGRRPRGLPSDQASRMFAVPPMMEPPA